VPLPIMNVRRMAALDLWGSAGGRRRRLVIRWEFVVGVFGCFALGALVLASTSSSVWLLIGVWLVGAGSNTCRWLRTQRCFRVRVPSSESLRASTRAANCDGRGFSNSGSQCLAASSSPL
jgi:hypothetical protein